MFEDHNSYEIASQEIFFFSALYFCPSTVQVTVLLDPDFVNSDALSTGLLVLKSVKVWSKESTLKTCIYTESV